ncbi:MAG: ABC transporter ATP-binding protein [Actinomyces sp.]|uniref:ABC transporter ATP-binding protein n=1 Tax=Actinomyces sp. TaxID=29317 RepID=UPI0026DDC117|nr:ABC transporter ATP-binding protein [Actinomyces sp.]MDO4244229.1 ABC transporter ATP-binding protein [Actinomyces sp.]
MPIVGRSVESLLRQLGELFIFIGILWVLVLVQKRRDESQSILVANALVAGYGKNPVCAPVSFALEFGRVLALVGVNGAGKSTLLGTCCGLIPPLGGQVSVLGDRPDPRSGSQRQVLAVDVGGDAFFPSLTVREHLRLVCYGHAVAHPDEVVATLLDHFGLLRLAGAVPDQLSGGQRRRLTLASVFARPSDLIVLDEPEQRLDRTARHMLAFYMRRKRDSGGAVLLATHDVELVKDVATDVLVVGDEPEPVDVATGTMKLMEIAS